MKCAILVFLFPIGILQAVHATPEVSSLTGSLTQALSHEGCERPRIAWGGASHTKDDVAEYDWAGAVMLLLEKRGVPFFVQAATTCAG